MNHNNSQRRSRSLREYIEPYCNGSLSAEQTSEFEQLLRDDSRAMDEFVLYMEIHSRIAWNTRAQGSKNQDQTDLSANEHLGGDIVSASRVKKEKSYPPFIALSPAATPASTPFIGGPVFSYMVASVVLCMMILGSWAYKVTSRTEVVDDRGTSPIEEQVPQLAGWISGLVDCEWADGDVVPYVGSSVVLGRKYELKSGLMEITYKNGARVILEGPCNYSVDSAAGGYLAMGKLAVRVEKKVASGQWLVASAKPQAATPQSLAPDPQPPTPPPSTLHSPLFTVSTPTAVVTDLGTEFGVEVSENGDTLSRVFQGAVRVDVIAGKAMENVVLHKDESARVVSDENGVRILRDEVGVAPLKFVRHIRVIPKRIDLLDIVAGGDGLGSHRERGIAPTTGRGEYEFFTDRRDGDHQYLPVAWHRMIDGVFVPDGSAGPVQLNSAGRTFDDFPATTNQSYGSIWSRGAEIRWNNLARDKMHWIYAMGQGEQYMPENRGLLGLHSNAGITFDLEAMRRVHPGFEPTRFRAVVGLNNSRDHQSGVEPMADVWILVDGRLELKRTGLCSQDGPVTVNIKLDINSRFLTLVSTDGGNNTNYDWIVFGDPVLEMVTAKEKGESEERRVGP